MNLHPIGKQFRKLQNQQDINIEEMAKYIIKLGEDRTSNIQVISPLYDWVEELLLFSLDPKNNKGSERIYNVIDTIILGTFTHPFLMDLYAIPRILYIHPKSKIKIYFAGDYHSDVLESLMNHFYPETHIKTQRSYKRGRKRCINTASEYRSEYEPYYTKRS